MSIIYVGLVMLAAFALVSLAVDLGRVRVGKIQLSTAADAAAIAGVQKLPFPDQPGVNPKQDATDIALKNNAIEGGGSGTPVALAPNDVVLGLYRKNGGTFTAEGSSESWNRNFVERQECNACQVTARRDGTHKVGLFFGRAIGWNEIDVTARAIAFIRGGKANGIGFVGIDWVKFNGTTNTDSYNYLNGPYDPNNHNQNGSIASNGTITLVGTVTIAGDARPGEDSVLNQNQNSTVTGWTAPLDKPLDYPPLAYSPPNGNADNSTLPSSIYNNGKKAINAKTGDNETIGGGGKTFVLNSWTMTGGTITIKGPCQIYINNNLKMSGDAKINIDGTSANGVVIWCNGDFDQQGTTEINTPKDPGALTINMTGANTSLDVSAQLAAHIYAPLSNVTLHGNAQNPPADFYGWIIGKTLTIMGNAELHYDESRNPPDDKLRASLVK